MTTVWLTSDPHWSHRWVSTLRGFESPEAHDLALLESLQSTVDKRDTVFWLGDLTMGNPDIAIAFTQAIPAASHHLILGNHDKAHPKFSDSRRWQKRYFEAFDSVSLHMRIKVGGQPVLLSHHPYDGEGSVRPDLEERDTQWRIKDMGLPLVHGHVHSTDRITQSKNGTPMLHVGLDAWDLKPVNIETVRELLL